MENSKYLKGLEDRIMRYEIQNECLRAEIDSFGAELKSLRRKGDGREYMWHGDPAYWGRTSPVLFPFVGAVKNKTYMHEGKKYPMGQHGFARDMEFSLISAKEDEIYFELRADADTLQKYPFQFVLRIGYRLEGRTLTVLWKVINEGEEEMFFSIGAHPAFLCPIRGEKNKVGYGLKFRGLDTAVHHHGNTGEGMAVMEDEVLPLERGAVKFTEDFFDKCTYMVEGKQTDQVSLITPEGEPYVTVTFDAPLFAIWSPEGKNAPFVCIEPWYGRCDAVDFSGELRDRDYEMRLATEETFESSYQIGVS